MCCQHVLWQLWAVGFPALSESLPLTFGAVVPALPMLWQGCEGQRSNPERKEKGAALKGRRAVCNPWLLGLLLPKEGNCWGCQYNYLFFFLNCSHRSLMAVVSFRVTQKPAVSTALR